MKKISANWVFPVNTEPMQSGVLLVENDGTVVDVISSAENRDGVINYQGILCPGFINCHCHLELSHLRGQIPEKTGLINFLHAVVSLKNAEAHAVREAMTIALEEMVANGIVAVGDICNTAVSFGVKLSGKINCHNFIELIGIDPAKADSVFAKGRKTYSESMRLGFSSSIVPHATYTASPPLLKLINNFSVENGSSLSIHNQESNSENEFFMKGTGPIAEFYKTIGQPLGFFRPTGKKSLVSYLKSESGNGNLLLVHNTYTSLEEIKNAIRTRDNLYWCFCPNANLYIENNTPDFLMFDSLESTIVIGTDSLASNRSLSVLDELKTITDRGQIPLHTLLRWATINGAKFLGLDEKLGSFEKGKKPGVNLIQGVDFKNMKLTKASSVKRLL